MCFGWSWFTEKLFRWQDLSAGILGFGAAIYAVRKALQSEQRKEDRELLAINRSLTAEIFQFATHSIQAHQNFKSATMRPDGLTIHELEEATRFVAPVIYPSIGSRIGFLGDHAHEVVLFYARIQVLLDTVVRIRRDSIEKYSLMRDAQEALSSGGQLAALKAQSSTQFFIGKENSKEAIEKLLIIAETGEKLLPHLTKGTIDEIPVSNFQKATKEAREAWGINRFNSIV